MKHKKDDIFLDKSKVALEFLQHGGVTVKFINLERNYYFFFDFQPVTVPIHIPDKLTHIAPKKLKS